MKRSQLAKLTRPRLHRAVAREKLFELLDEKREYPVVWIVAPPGAGKTTLAASYLEASGAPAIWYQIDPGDSDPASFFFYLKQAVEQTALRKSRPLPLLAPEYLPDLPGFARRFLREMFLQLPEDLIIVLDNYHDIAAASYLHAALAAALPETPTGANFVVLSRADVPPAYASFLIRKTISVITWDELRLAPEETQRLAAAGGVTDPRIVQRLHQHSGGWIAGLTLMLERLHRGDKLETLHRPEALGTIFDYFAGLIFDHASTEMQDVLMKTALLPWVNSTLADTVTGVANAVGYLEELHRRHLFIDRRTDEGTTYHYHALFRTFLQSRASAALPEATRQLLLGRAAAELLARGNSVDAFALFVQVRDWTRAGQVVIDSAPLLIAQGRWQTLGQWIEQLPDAHVRSNPWVGYWHGRSMTFVDPVSARPALEVAYRAFSDSGDEIGQLLSATTILEGIYFEFENLKPMDPWIERVVELLQSGVRPPTREDDLRANSVVMMGATFRAPVHSMLGSCLRRVLDLLNEPFASNLKIAAAGMLHAYSNVAMDAQAERMASIIARPLLDANDVSPQRAIFYWTAEGYSHYLRGRFAQALECFDAADAIVKEHALQDVHAVALNFRRGLCERRAGLLDEAEATIRRAERMPITLRGHYHAGFILLRAVVGFDRGNIQHGIETILEAYKAYDDAGFFNGIVTVGTVASNMAIAGGRYDVADRILNRLRGEEYGAIAENYIAAIVLNQAWLAHRRGEIGARDTLLADAMRRAGTESARVRFHWYANALTELLPIALATGIETDMARALAREFAVAPLSPDIEDWPWPVKVYTLGRFELLVEGESPDYSRKVPRKVLALLKAIIAQGAVGVPEQKLIDALWPDQEGDSGQRSLATTLHRLRKLLGNGNALLQSGGKLTLDKQVCWIDVRAFENRMETGFSDLVELGTAIKLYRGDFLPQEENAAWIVPARERLRTKFIHAIGKLGSAFEAADENEAAIDLYLRGIETDNLVEPFYQGLMRCYAKLDRCTEAMGAYRRLRELLSVTLGAAPSSTTQRLFAGLQLDRAES